VSHGRRGRGAGVAECLFQSLMIHGKYSTFAVVYGTPDLECVYMEVFLIIIHLPVLWGTLLTNETVIGV
jgi:hypothetical protein